MTRPYFERDGITIYHGDCREVLPGLACDVVVTDPPYGTGAYATDVAVLDGAMLNQWPRAAVFGYAERIVSLCIAAGRTPDEWVTWWPTNGACRGLNFHGLRREAEHIAVFGSHRMSALRQPRAMSSRRMYAVDYRHGDGGVGKGLDTNGELETRGLGDVWTDASPGLGFLSSKRQHPNEKPVALLTRLVDGLSIAGETVLDPFMGSGTTLRAALDLGRRAIGIEIEERYCEIAARRLDQMAMPLEW